MIDDLKNLQAKNLYYIDSNKLFPLMRWNSGDVTNLKLCKNINRDFMFVDKNILLGYFAYNLKPVSYVKYPKPKTYNDKKLDLICNILQQHYKYGQNDIDVMKPLLIKLLNNNEQLEKFARNFGLSNNDRKLLGLNEIKVNKNKLKQKKLF
ncbi:MAG: hypothetical protein ACOCRX_03990 [Candidatus Woesearchaeota archaeon]